MSSKGYDSSKDMWLTALNWNILTSCCSSIIVTLSCADVGLVRYAVTFHALAIVLHVLLCHKAYTVQHSPTEHY